MARRILAAALRLTKCAFLQVAFSIAWPEYAPTEYTAPLVLAKPEWADDADNFAAIKFNQLDVDNHVLAGKVPPPSSSLLLSNLELSDAQVCEP